MTDKGSSSLGKYLESTGLPTAVNSCLKDLSSSSKLPSNPYSSILSSLRLQEIKGNLFTNPAHDKSWLDDLQDGKSYGIIDQKSAMTPRKISKTKNSELLQTMSLAPALQGGVTGMKHVVEALDAQGMLEVVKVNNVSLVHFLLS